MKYYINGVTFRTLNTTSPFLTCLDFGVCATQSASFALATIRPPDGLFNASRPYRRSPLKGNPRRPLRVGQHDAIDFVTIALPSLCSLRHSHR